MLFSIVFNCVKNCEYSIQENTVMFIGNTNYTPADEGRSCVGVIGQLVIFLKFVEQISSAFLMCLIGMKQILSFLQCKSTFARHTFYALL